MTEAPPPPTPHAEGFAIIPNWLIRDAMVSGPAKLVLLSITSRIGRDNDIAWPSHPTLAAEAGVGVTRIKKALSELKDLGLISWTQRADPRHGGLTSNAYRVHLTPRREATHPPS